MSGASSPTHTPLQRFNCRAKQGPVARLSRPRRTAQSMLGRGLAQCRAKRRTRCERAERAGQALGADARRGNEFRYAVDPLRDARFFLAPERAVMRGQARFDEHRFTQQRTELTGGALVLDAANLLRKPQIGFAAPVL